MIYTKFGKRITFTFGYFFAFLGVLIIFFLQLQEIAQREILMKKMKDKDGHIDDDQIDIDFKITIMSLDYLEDNIIPCLMLIIKFGIGISFLAAY